MAILQGKKNTFTTLILVVIALFALGNINVFSVLLKTQLHKQNGALVTNHGQNKVSQPDHLSMDSKKGIARSIPMLYKDLIGLNHIFGNTKGKWHPSNVQMKPRGENVVLDCYDNSMDPKHIVLRRNDSCKCKVGLLYTTRRTFFSIVSKDVYAFHSNNCSTYTETVLAGNVFHSAPCIQMSANQHMETVKDNIYFNITNKNYGFASKKHLHPSMIGVDYMFVLKNVFVLPHGDVDTMLTCHPEKPLKGNITQYDKVFVISRYAGFAYYHFLIDNLVRIGTGLPFLLQHRHLKVHIQSKERFVIDYFSELGIKGDRLITGLVKAKTVYYPSVSKPTDIFPMNALSVFLKRNISESRRDLIVLIKRSAIRWFINHDSIFEMLKTFEKRFGLRVEVFGDDPQRSVQETRRIFNKAVMVVSPHGAGLTNMLFSKKRTCIIEALCFREIEKPWFFPLMYKEMALSLGHIYYGVVPARYHKSCMEMKAETLEQPVQHCLETIVSK